MTEGADPVDLHAGRRIRAARKAAGVTQEQLAQHLGLTFQQVQKYERAANRVSVSMLYRIAERLGVEPAFVYEGLPGPARGAAVANPLDDFALAPGAFPLAEMFPRLSRSRQAALVAVARALFEEQGATLTGRSGADGSLRPEARTVECRLPPPPPATTRPSPPP